LQLITFSVPFTAQAPLGDWADPRQQDGCEEASVLMAMAWVRDEKFADEVDALAKILALSEWQEQNYGSGLDTSAQDTAERLFRNYFEHESVTVHEITSINQIIEALQQQQLVVTPMDGRELGNPYFTAPGPERHMVVIIGYDPETEEFITNDPGTKRGQNYRYDQTVFFEAIRDYPTGEHEPITKTDKMMIVIAKID
jgi:peptidase C39-like protein